MGQLTILMYHYVRDLKGSGYPNIKGLDIVEFKSQLDYLQNYYQFVTMTECIEAIRGNQRLPNNAVLLTFDDGYLDHFQFVLPELLKRKIQGSFFPPAQPVMEKKVLDVNKIHFILASSKPGPLIEDLFKQLENLRDQGISVPTREAILTQAQNYEVRYDKPEVTMFKRLLQRDLELPVRTKIVDGLFKKFVTEDEKSFASGLYMSLDQLRKMKAEGMYIGSHGWSHCFLNAVSTKTQKEEVEKSMEFLRSVGTSLENWVLCYPYGAYDQSLLKLLPELGCVVGLTTEVGLANLDRDNALTLKRLDTNEFPKNFPALPNLWTKSVNSGVSENG